MAKASPALLSFNSGEFGPLMAGRIDLKYYANGCRRIRNHIPTVQGPARRRSGTRFVSAVKDNTKRVWLARFEFNVEQAYVLEFGDQYIRFYANHAQVESSPGVPLEVSTPYALADLTDADGLFTIRYVQSNDVLYLVHPDYPPQKLIRTGAAAFTLTELEVDGGPFEKVDPLNTVTVYSSHNTGTGRTLTASSAIFNSSHVGALFLLEEKNANSITQWESGKSISAGAVRRSDGKNYTAANSATTGTVRPTHTYGARYDGDAGVQWTYDDPGFGWCRITAVGGGGTTATVDILSRIPDNATGSGNATTRWAFGEWSDANGWPEHVTFFRNRLCFARGQRIWFSVSADYEVFTERDKSGLSTEDMAITADITSDRSNRIEWLAPSDIALLIGTAGDEHALAEITASEAFSQGNARARKQSEYGSRRVPVARVGDGVVFVQKSGRKVRNMQLAESVETRFVAPDMTVLAEHVTKSGIVDCAYQQEPNSVVWYVLANGGLVGLTLNMEQDVKGWHPHRIGGFSNSGQTEFAKVESVVSIPAPGGDRNEVWMVVRRYINGSSRRYVEYLEAEFERGDDPEDQLYMDSALTLDNTVNATLTPGAGATVKGTVGVLMTAGSAVFSGADVGKEIRHRYVVENEKGEKVWNVGKAAITAIDGTNTIATVTINSAFPSTATIAANDWKKSVTTVSGLTHLIGQTVRILADGKSQPDKTVNGSGQITLTNQACKVQIGLATKAVLMPMPIEAGSQNGVAQGKTQRISRAVIRFENSLGCQYGYDEDKQLDTIEFRTASDPMDEAPPLYSGDKTVSWPSGYDQPALVTMINDSPYTSTVVAVMPQIATQDDR